MHTFTHVITAADSLEDDYEDNREKRCFDYERYRHSHQLPALIKQLPTRRIHSSVSRTGTVNYVTHEVGDSTYAVFFDMKLFEKQGANAVLLTVNSAYVLNEGKTDRRQDRIGFNAIVGRILLGARPKASPSKR